MSSYTILCDIIMEFVSSSCWDPPAVGICSTDSPPMDSVKFLPDAIFAENAVS